MVIGNVDVDKEPGEPMVVVTAGQKLAMSVFGRQNGATQKAAIVLTTIRKGQLLSFAFVANSPELLEKLTESMKTLQFF